ncbi:MAG: HIT family protein [Actinomycetota bacterium]
MCRGAEGDPELGRVQVWENEHWRLTIAVGGQVPGFSFLEPKRHIPHITDIDGEEAKTFGDALATTTSALKEAAGAELVYVYVFGGGIPHLHVHLAPHREGDALNDLLLKGELETEKLPSGATKIVSKDFPMIEDAEHRRIVERARELLSV